MSVFSLVQARDARKLIGKRYSLDSIALRMNCSVADVTAGLKMLRSHGRRVYASHYTTNRKPPNEEIRPSPEIIAIQQSRMMLRPQTVTALLMGDPLPGESALARRSV